MNDLECALAAWSIEWEGSVTLTKRHNKGYDTYLISPQVAIGNTSKELLDTFCEIVGIGKVYPANKKKRSPNNSDVFVWSISGQEVIKNFLEEILPFLITKKERAELVIEFCKSRLSKKSNGVRKSWIPYDEDELEYVELCYVLNKRGVKEVQIIA